LLERVRPMLQRRAAESDMTIVVDANDALEAEIQTDAEAYGQILFNLIDNACKYASDAEDRSIQIRLRQDGQRFVTSVCDYGTGIAPKQAGTIFEPFERGTFGASDKPGIGLGLPLSRRLARDLGGDLKCLTDQREGACFELALPLGSGSA
jgi:signal transduction histidine kinase